MNIFDFVAQENRKTGWKAVDVENGCIIIAENDKALRDVLEEGRAYRLTRVDPQAAQNLV